MLNTQRLAQRSAPECSVRASSHGLELPHDLACSLDGVARRLAENKYL